MTTCLVIAAIVRCTLAGPVLSPADAAAIVARLPNPIPVTAPVDGRGYAVAGDSRQQPATIFPPSDPSPGRVYLPTWLPTPGAPIIGVVNLDR